VIANLRPYSVYKDSGVPWLGQVPGHWLVRPLKRCASINRRTLAEDTVPEYAFRYVDIGTVGTGYLARQPEKMVFAESPSRARRVLRQGDTVVSTVRTYLKAVWCVNDNSGDLVASTGFAVLTPGKEVDPQYLSRTIQGSSFVDRVSAESVGVAYPAISETVLGRLEIAVPPALDEQSGIVHYLDYMDRRIRKYIRAKQRLIALLNEQKQAIIQHAVTRGLDPTVRLKPSGVPWLGDIPGHWDMLPLKRWVTTKITDGPHETPQWLDDGIPFISAEAMVDGRLEFSHRRGFISRELHEVYCKKCRPQRNDIFMCKSGATTGKVAIVETDDEFSVWSPLALIRVNPERVLPRLLFAVLHSPYVQRQVQDTWSYGTQPNLSMAALERIAVVLPPLAEQIELLVYLDQVTEMPSETIRRTQREIALLREYRTRLIADVVTGKLDVRAAAASLPDEPEEEPEPLDETSVDEADANEETTDGNERGHHNQSSETKPNGDMNLQARATTEIAVEDN
jgi:type I restriction enzyme S subunit